MTSIFMPKISDAPFPVNCGATQVCRTIGCVSALPTSGPCAMPHLPVFPAFPGRDAVGRICVADGLGRVYAGFPEIHVQANKTLMPADFLFGVVRNSAVALAERIEGGMLAFCVLNEQSVMYVARGLLEEASTAYPGIVASSEFPKSVETFTGLSGEQLKELTNRLCSSYRQYGVGSLTTDAGGFTFQVLVPNAKEYALHQAAYDAEQAAKRARRLRVVSQPVVSQPVVSQPVVSLPVVASYPLDLPTEPRKRAKFDAEVDAMVRRITGKPSKVLKRAEDGEM
jgi:hypothetical protein